MKTLSQQLLVNTAGQLMQEHAFDHLPDEKINRIRQSFKRLADNNTPNNERKKHQEELLNLCSEADLYTETTSSQSLQQWFTVMHCFGLNTNQSVALHEEID